MRPVSTNVLHNAFLDDIEPLRKCWIALRSPVVHIIQNDRHRWVVKVNKFVTCSFSFLKRSGLVVVNYLIDVPAVESMDLLNVDENEVHSLFVFILHFLELREMLSERASRERPEVQD